MTCEALLDIAAEHIVKHIARPDDDLDTLREGARLYLLEQMR